MKSYDLIRLEHKIDLIIRALQESNLMLQDLPNLEGVREDTCALCNFKIKLIVDPVAGEVIRKCGCKLPIKAYKLDLTIPTNEDNNANIRTETDEVPPDEP